MLAGRLDRGVVLYDADLNLVAFSAQGEDTDTPRRTIVLARHASAAARTLIGRSGANRSRTPVRIPPYEPTGARGRVVLPIRHKDRLYGYLTYIDDAPVEAPVPDSDARTLIEVEPELGRLLARRALNERRARSRAGRLLGDLLSDEPGRHGAADTLLDDGLLPAAPAYVVAVVRGSADGGPRTAEVRLGIEEALAEFATFSALPVPWTMRGDHGVLLLARSAAPDLVNDLAARPGVVIGTGDPRRRLSETRAAYREALAAAEVARRSPGERGPVVAWAETGADRLLVRLPLDQLTTADLPPAVQALLTAGGELTDTLESYLDHACDAQATARTLLIHRSTLYYRLGRIKQITGADLTDGPTRLELHLGVKVARIARLA